MPLRPLPMVVTVLAQGKGSLRCLSLQADSRPRARQQGQTPASVHPVRSRASTAPILLIAIALLGACPAEARCRRAVLEAAQAAEQRAALEIDGPEQELGAEPEVPNLPKASGQSRMRVAALDSEPNGKALSGLDENAAKSIAKGVKGVATASGPDAPPAAASERARPISPEPMASVDPTRTSITTPPFTAPEPSWPIEPGKSLRQTLTEWTARAGWHLVWSPSLAQVDYLIEAGYVWHGDFLKAVKELMRNYRTVDVPLKVEPILGNRQLRVLAESDGFSSVIGDD
jgi:hypothetical protein